MDAAVAAVDGGHGPNGNSGVAADSGMPAGGGAASAQAAGGGGSVGGGGAAGAGSGSLDAGPCDSSSGSDCCPSDPNKTGPGICGCGVPDADGDSDGKPDCIDPPLGWQKQMTFDAAQVDAILNDFPVLVRLSDSDLAARAAVGGHDIYFVDASRTNVLNHEIERYDAQTGALVAWVLLPTLDATSDTVIYLRYGDGAGDRSNATALWSGHRYVWHLAQDPGPGGTGDIRDSTGHANATAVSSMSSSALIDAVAGKGFAFNGSDDELTFRNDLSGTSPSTMSAWVLQLADDGDSGSAIVSLGNEAKDAARFLFSLDAISGNVDVGFYSDDHTGTALTKGVWSHLVWTWDGSSSSIYINGTRTTGPFAHAGANTTGTAGKIGNSVFRFSRFLHGQLDEVRVSTLVRPSAWIQAEYNNQRVGSTFTKALGPEEVVTP